MLVASHSGKWIEDAYNSGTFWVGDKECGWDACTLTITNNVKESAILNKGNVFVGIPLPVTPPTGAKINFCGIAFAEDTDVVNFGTYLGFFSCDDRDGSGNYPITTLFEDSTTSVFDDKTTCFNTSYIVVGNEGLHHCDTFLIAGMNADGGTPNYTIKFSYTITIVYSCNT